MPALINFSLQTGTAIQYLYLDNICVADVHPSSFINAKFKEFQFKVRSDHSKITSDQCCKQCPFSFVLALSVQRHRSWGTSVWPLDHFNSDLESAFSITQLALKDMGKLKGSYKKPRVAGNSL